MPARWEEAEPVLARPPRLIEAVELRLDRIGQAVPPGLLAARRVRVIAACRRPRDGGTFRGEERDRIGILAGSARAGADFVDVECRFVGQLRRSIPEGRRIVSWHDPRRTPADLDGIVRRLASAGGRFLKLAARAEGPADNLRLLRLLSARGELPLAAFCMGERGRLSRLLARRFGSALDYVALDEERPTAPGQFSAREWLESLPAGGVGPRTRLYGLLGNPLARSASPRLQNAFFRAHGMDAAYVAIESDGFEEALSAATALGFAGLNVTAPFKETAAARCDSAGGSLRRFHSANVLCAVRSGWKGFNTDAPAFLAAVRETFGRDWPLGRRILILGAGGGGLAVARAIRVAGGIVFLSARNPGRLARSAAAVGATAVPWRARDEFAGDLVVNATPIGMAKEETPIHDRVWKKVRAAADFVYVPPVTRMLEAARWSKCRILPGTRMFAGQAARSFRLWTGRRAPLDDPDAKK